MRHFEKSTAAGLIAWFPGIHEVKLTITFFGNRATADLFNGVSSSKVRRLPTQILDSAIYKLDVVNAAATLDDLRSPPGNRLEALRGDYAGFHSVRVNTQWRIVFRWAGSDAQDVAIVDYHA